MKKEISKKPSKKISEKGTAILKYVKEVQTTAKEKYNIDKNMVVKDYTIKNDKIYMYGIR